MGYVGYGQRSALPYSMDSNTSPVIAQTSAGIPSPHFSGGLEGLGVDNFLDSASQPLDGDEIWRRLNRGCVLGITCPFCFRQFYKKSHFMRHYYIHTGEKPFKCPYCPHRAN